MARGSCVTATVDGSMPRLVAVAATTAFSSSTVSMSLVASESVPG